mgnify:CR=1 FL=1
MKKAKCSKISTAVILAAGMGIRLREVIGLCPKGLLEIGGKSLILRSMQLLKKEGIEKVILVTGFQEALYYRHFQNQDKIPKLEFVHSPKFAETGSMHSLFEAKDFLVEDFLLLESDLLYESRALKSVINFDGSDVVLSSGKTGSNDEVFIYGENKKDDLLLDLKSGKICGEIKAISKNPCEKFSIKGELVGISKISMNLFKLMCSHYEGDLNFPNRNHYEECISELCSENKIPYLRVDDLVWTEIDDQSHYDRAVKEIFPKITKILKR